MFYMLQVFFPDRPTPPLCLCTSPTHSSQVCWGFTLGFGLARAFPPWTLSTAPVLPALLRLVLTCSSCVCVCVCVSDESVCVCVCVCVSVCLSDESGGLDGWPVTPILLTEKCVPHGEIKLQDSTWTVCAGFEPPGQLPSQRHATLSAQSRRARPCSSVLKLLPGFFSR